MQRKQLLSFLLAVVCFLSLMYFPIPNATAARDFTEDEIDIIVRGAAKIIQKNEGSYRSVNADDNGSMSIGKMQWHGNRALELLKLIIAEFELQGPENEAYYILQYTSNASYTSLYQEIKQSTSWRYRVADPEEYTALQELLDTLESHVVQDAQEARDIRQYIAHGINLGITDPACLVYYADIENQFGEGGAQKYHTTRVYAVLGSSEINNLILFHDTLMSEYKKMKVDDEKTFYDRYGPRRINTYNFCMQNLCGMNALFHRKDGEVTTIPPTATSHGSECYTCTYCSASIEVFLPCSGPGDINADGDVNSEDLLILTRHLTGISSAAKANRADMNGDGTIDSADLALLSIAVNE